MRKDILKMRNKNNNICTSKRIIYFDALNVIATLGVVMMHSSMNVFKFENKPIWIYETITNHLFYWAVPVFFMLSGATLIGFNERYSITEYVKKRIQRTLIPFLAWSCLGILLGVAVTHHMPSVHSPKQLIEYVDAIINTKVPGLEIYWFFIPLYAIYCCIPLFSCIPVSKRLSIFSFLAFYSFLTYAFLPDVFPYLGLTFNHDICNPAAAGFLMYPLLGYVLSHYDIKPRIRNALIIVGIVIFFCWMSYDIFASLRKNTLVFTSGYFHTPVVCGSISVFLLVKEFDSTKFMQHCSAVLRKLSKLSFGVYLIHIFIITFLMRTPFYQMSIWPVIAFVIAYPLSLFISYVMTCVSFLRWLV